MKIAFLMQAHKNPKQINRFINIFPVENFDIYIHIDKKSDIETLIDRKPNVFFLPTNKRIDVQWGGVTQIDATLELLKACRLSDYDYYWLCSGQDFPLCSPDEIISVFQQNNKDFIHFSLSTEEIETNSVQYRNFCKRNITYYPSCMFKRTIVAKAIRKLYVKISGGGTKTIKIFRRKDHINDGKYYFGSSWWCLRRVVVQWMMKYLNEHPEFYEFFSRSICPDECFFQTLYMMSPYAGQQYEDNLYYIDWSRKRGSPEVLTISDYEALLASNQLMARKFDMYVDVDIINALEQKVYMRKGL